ncbi:hypothetical protein BRCON_0408 [Candidatus Sumerlaea chitinivorans]|uniref:Uncharacterized protein n=1 Tax=Sumerlaea chitinivorans TaxID=2250252 RepID=A0A2Z4Y414_SUMC1|nr:hypothetical protein BRCON_0408 [Candidatus Sumerlaea chitinivorans]
MSNAKRRRLALNVAQIPVASIASPQLKCSTVLRHAVLLRKLLME